MNETLVAIFNPFAIIFLCISVYNIIDRILEHMEIIERLRGRKDDK